MTQTITTSGTGTASDPIIESYPFGDYTNETLTYHLNPGSAPVTITPPSLPYGAATAVFDFPGYTLGVDAGTENIGKGYLLDADGNRVYSLALSYGQGTATLTATYNATGATHTVATINNVATVLVDGQWKPENGTVPLTTILPGPSAKGLPLDAGQVILTDQAGGSTDSATLVLSGNVVHRFDQATYNFANGQVVNITNNGVPAGSATIRSVNIPGTARYVGPNDSAWATSIALTPGNNAITITTTDSTGLSASKTLNYVYMPPAATGTGTATAGSGTGTGGNPAAPAPATPGAPADRITLDPDVSYLGHDTFKLTGHASSAAGVRQVVMTATVDGVATTLGAASVAADGSFSFTDRVGRHTQGKITATLTDGAGHSASAAAGYDLQAGLTGSAIAAVQYSHDPQTGAVGSVSRFRANGSRVVQVLEGHQTVTSHAFDTFFNGGRPGTTFVFDPGYGRDVVQQLRLGGSDHDTLSLPASDFTSIADVLSHTQQTKGGAVIHDPKTHEAIRLVGVSKSALFNNQSSIALHD